MSAADLVVIIASILLIFAFVALIVVLLRVIDTMRDLRRQVDQLTDETRHLVDDLRVSTDDARDTVDEARHDLERFDRVLGSAEAIGDAVGSTVARSAFSSPAIKAAGIARGASRTMARLRGKTPQPESGNVIDVQRRMGELEAEPRRRRA
jgi:predicted PurR-regulated permease PerM